MNPEDIDELDLDGMSDEAAVIICQGPPRCPLRGEAAIKAQNDGCIWCDRIYFSGDREFKIGPGDKLH